MVIHMIIFIRTGAAPQASQAMPTLPPKQAHFSCLRRLFHLGLKTSYLSCLFEKRCQFSPFPSHLLFCIELQVESDCIFPMGLKKTHTQRKLQFFVNLYQKKNMSSKCENGFQRSQNIQEKYKYRSDQFILKSGRQKRFWSQYAGALEVLNVT